MRYSLNDFTKQSMVSERREKFWFKKAVQAVLAQNKSDVEKAEEITEMAYKLNK